MKKNSKKKIFIVILLIAIVIAVVTIFMINKSDKNIIKITAGSIDFKETITVQQIKQELDESYAINGTESSSNNEEEAKAIDFANKITFLLLGAPNEGQVDYLEYKKREEEFNKMLSGEDIHTTYQRSGIRYKITKNPKTTRKNLRNRILNYKDYGKATVINMGDDEVEVKVYLDNVTEASIDEDEPQKVNEKETKMELRYYLKRIYGEYRLNQIKYRISDDVTAELESAAQKESNSLTQNIANMNTINTKENTEYDFTKLNNLTEEKQKEIYNNNVDNILVIKGYDITSLSSTVTGFLISKGFVVTTWNAFENILSNSQYVVISDNNGNTYELDGVVSIDASSDLAVLKLKEQKESTIKFGDSNKLQKEDPIVSINTKTGFKLSMMSGIVIENENGTMKNLLDITNTDEGSPVFNENGELVGINTAKSINSSISVAKSTNVLKDLSSKLSKENYENVKSISFEELKEKFYYKKKNEETVDNQLSDKVWNEYKQIGDIENTITLKLNKASYYNGIVSLRYENDISEYMSSMTRAYKFIAELKKSGYVAIYESKEKSIYQSSKYKVTIMDEMGYLIVIMTKA